MKRHVWRTQRVITLPLLTHMLTCAHRYRRYHTQAPKPAHALIHIHVHTHPHTQEHTHMQLCTRTPSLTYYHGTDGDTTSVAVEIQTQREQETSPPLVFGWEGGMGGGVCVWKKPWGKCILASLGHERDIKGAEYFTKGETCMHQKYTHTQS